MKSLLFLAILLISFFSGGIASISNINQYAQDAATAYTQKNYAEAIATYKHLLDDLEVEDDQLRLNLAHAYYQAGLYPQALATYQLLADHPTQHLRALAHLQIGNIYCKQKKYKRALVLYKQTLITEPSNEAARYNFELLKKYLELHPEAAETEEDTTTPAEDTEAEPDSLQGPPPAEEDLEPQPKQKPDEQGDREEEIEKQEQDPKGQQQQASRAGGQNSEQGNSEREEAAGNAPGNTKGQSLDNKPAPTQQHSNSAEAASAEDQLAQTRRQRLQQANMSPEKAKLLLDAMRNAELQYIQQLPKKATKKPDPSKPDW